MLHRFSSSLTSCVWRWKQAAQDEYGGSPRAYAHSHFGKDAAKALQKFPLWVQLLSIKEEWRWLYLFQHNQATMRNKRTLSSWAVTPLNTARSVTTGPHTTVWFLCTGVWQPLWRLLLSNAAAAGVAGLAGILPDSCVLCIQKWN